MNYRLRAKKIQRRKWIRGASFLGILLFFSFMYAYYFERIQGETWTNDSQKEITLTLGGSEFFFTNVASKTIEEFLTSRNITLASGDSIFPSQETALFSGTHIIITQAKDVVVTIDGSEQMLRTQATTVGQALNESTLTLDQDDIVEPARATFAENGIRVTITRVQIEEQVIEKPIAFDKKINEDNNLSWRKSSVTQKGENGIQRLTYRVSKHDGKEVNRTLLGTEVIKEPTTQVMTQGTFVKLGKSHTGGASWYAFTGTMAAANPWLPKGSYVRVTNLENRKSVIVVINDRGPFVPGRIIDLDKVAFQKIASIGSGVIEVKMEEIIN